MFFYKPGVTLSLWPAGALRQLLPPEGAGGTAGAPSSAQRASTGSGEPRDGRVSGRGPLTWLLVRS